MQKPLSRKIVGLVLVAALIALQVFISMPASATTTYVSLFQSFDTMDGIGAVYPSATQIGICKSDGTQTYTDASTSQAVNPLSIVSESGRGNVLRFKKTPATAAYTSHVLIRGTETAGITGITAGTYYNAIVSFDYRVETADCAGNGTLLKQFNLAADSGYYRYNWGLWNSPTNSCSKLISVNDYSSAEEPESNYSALKLIKDGQWHTYSFAVTLGSADGGNKLGFVFDSPAKDDIEFYLDNVGLTVIDVSTGTNGATVCLHSNGGNALDLMGGIVGETMTLPAPQKNGYRFDGWYSDSELTSPAGSTFVANTETWGTKANAITNYYAKWTKLYDEMIQNFDSAESIGGVWGSETVIASDTTNLSLVAEEGRGNVLKVNKSNASGSYGTGIRIARDAGASSLGEVLADTTYNLIVTFDYKVEDASGNAWGPYIGRTYIYYTPYNYWSQGVSPTYSVAFDNSASAEEPESHYSAYRAICDGEWHTMSFKTSGKAIGYSENGAFVFTLDINDGDKFVACFDNFSVKKLAAGAEASTVVFHSNGGTACDVMTGIVGQRIDAPSPTKVMNSFSGWYTDSELTALAGGTFVANTETWGSNANAVTNYYAYWTLGVKSHSLTLSDAIGVNFFLDLSSLSAAEKAASYMTFDIPHGTVKTAAFDDGFTGNGGTYGFTCYVSPVQIAEAIVPTFHYKGLTLEGVGYSVKNYIDYAIANCSDVFGAKAAAGAELLKRIGDYGHYAQEYFGAKHGWTAGTNYTALAKYRPSDYTAANFTTRASNTSAKAVSATGITNGSNSGKYFQYALNLDYETSILVKFNTGNVSFSSVTMGGNNYSNRQNAYTGDNCILYLYHLPVTQLGEPITITGTVDGSSFDITVSALSYVYGVLSGSSSTALKNAVSAFYDYYAAASAYVS